MSSLPEQARKRGKGSHDEMEGSPSPICCITLLPFNLIATDVHSMFHDFDTRPLSMTIMSLSSPFLPLFPRKISLKSWKEGFRASLPSSSSFVNLRVIRRISSLLSHCPFFPSSFHSFVLLCEHQMEHEAPKGERETKRREKVIFICTHISLRVKKERKKRVNSLYLLLFFTSSSSLIRSQRWWLKTVAWEGNRVTRPVKNL